MFKLHKDIALNNVADKVTEFTTSEEFKTNLTDEVKNIVYMYTPQQPKDLKSEISKFIIEATENSDEFYEMVDTITNTIVKIFFYERYFWWSQIYSCKCSLQIYERPSTIFFSGLFCQDTQPSYFLAGTPVKSSFQMSTETNKPPATLFV